VHARALSIILATSVACAVAQASQSRPSTAAPADVRWNVSSTVFGDFTCRGQNDMAMFGTSERSGFVVMIQPARKGARTDYLLFAARGRDSKNMHLKIESLDFDGNAGFKNEVSSVPPDLVPSRTCKGLSLGDGETDSHHIYWNRAKRVFQSWSH
jgi:hypothetical protein